MDLLALMIGKWQASRHQGDARLAARGNGLEPAAISSARTILAIRERWPDVIDFHLHLHNQRGATIAS